MVSFAVQKLFSLMESHLFIFALVSLAIGIKFTETALRLMSRSLAFVSIHVFYGFRLCTQVFNPFGVHFSVWLTDSCLVSFFCMWGIFSVRRVPCMSVTGVCILCLYSYHLPPLTSCFGSSWRLNLLCGLGSGFKTMCRRNSQVRTQKRKI